MNEYKITMPEGWVPAMCPDCHIEYSKCAGICGEMDCPLSHAVPVKEVEPLAVLADRKGKSLLYVGPYYTCKWVITISNDGLNGNCVVAPTYPACEAKARAYLESLEDVKGGR